MNSPSISTSGLLLAALGVILFSTKAVMVKLAYPYGVHPISLLLLRMGFSLPIYLVILLWKRNEGEGGLTSKNYIGVLLAGVLGFFN